MLAYSKLIPKSRIADEDVYKRQPLFQYIITENRMEDGEFIIKGYHEQINSISESLSKRFLENGMPISTIEKLKKKEVQSL